MIQAIEEKERNAAEERLELLVEKRKAVQRGYDLEGNEGRRFDIKTELEDLDKEIKTLKQQCTDWDKKTRSAVSGAWSDFFQTHALRDDLRPTITVNCNRETHYTQGLYDHFRKTMRANRNQLYCIVACPYQRPASIAKRLVYELQERQLQIACFSDAARPDEVVVVDLTFGLEPEHTWAWLWEGVKTRVAPAPANATSPAALAEQCGDKQFIALLFRISAQQWERESHNMEHLQYLASQFQGQENNCKYLVFLAIEFPHIHSKHKEKYQNDLEQIKTLCQKANSERLFAECVDLLPPVQPDSIEKWSSDVLQKDKEAGFKRILEQLKTQVAAEDTHFSMEVVETMQEAAWAHRNRPRRDLPF